MQKTKIQKENINKIVNDCLVIRLRLINRMIGSLYDKALKPHGIKASQMSVLATVSAFDTTTSKQLSQLLHMDKSTLSRTLGILTKKNWLQVEPSGEGKILNIEITQDGLQKLDDAYPDWQEAQEKAVKTLGSSTAEEIISTGTKYLFSGMIV